MNQRLEQRRLPLLVVVMAGPQRAPLRRPPGAAAGQLGPPPYGPGHGCPRLMAWL